MRLSNPFTVSPEPFDGVWADWAAARGWGYRDPAPDLVGRWADSPSKRRERDTETYRFLMSTVIRDLPVWTCEHEWFYRQPTNHGRARVGLIAVQLPGRPPDELVRKPRAIDRAVRGLGASAPAGYEFYLPEPTVLVARKNRVHDPEVLAREVDHVVNTVTLAPPDFWH